MKPSCWTLLKGVSRSFYLSVRFLPRRIRMAIALGYLLARASDTIADTNQLPPAERIEFLDRFLRSIVNRHPGDSLDLAACLTAQADGPEKVLVANLDGVMACLAKIPPAHQALVHEVLTKIIHGQTLDIERFESKPGIHGLADDSELEEYTYLVAGCVGEFWTKICLLEWSNYARLTAGGNAGLRKGFWEGSSTGQHSAGLSSRSSEREILSSGFQFARDRFEPCSGSPGVGTMASTGFRIPGRSLEIRDKLSGLGAFGLPVRCLSSSGCVPLVCWATRPEIGPGLKVSRSEVRRLMVWAAGVAIFRFLEPVAYRTIFR